MKSNKQPPPYLPNKAKKRKKKPVMKTMGTQTTGVGVQAQAGSPAPKPKMIDSSIQTDKNYRGAGRPAGAKNKGN